nr:HrpE family protein [Xanthomonas cannabis]
MAQRDRDPSLDHQPLQMGEHPFMEQHEAIRMGQYPAVEQHELQRVAGQGRLSGAAATHAANQQIDSLLDDLGTSNADQKHMNSTITTLKNDLDYNVSLNKYIGKAGDNAKSLVGQ